MCHPVPLEFLKLLLACTMVSLPPSPARPAHVSFVGGGEGGWRGLTVNQIVYLLFCSLEFVLVPTFSSCLSFAVQKFICTYILENFVLQSKKDSIQTQYLLERGSCPAAWFPGYFVICSVQNALLPGLFTSYLFWCGTWPHALFVTQFLLLQSALASKE